MVDMLVVWGANINLTDSPYYESDTMTVPDLMTVPGFTPMILTCQNFLAPNPDGTNNPAGRVPTAIQLLLGLGS